MEKKDPDKRVRALTTLTKEDEIPDLAADYFDFEHHLPAVYALFSFIRLLLPCQFFLITFGLFLLPGLSVSCFSPPFQREALFKMFLPMLRLKPPPQPR
jgi:hypothetical protein